MGPSPAEHKYKVAESLEFCTKRSPRPTIDLEERKAFVDVAASLHCSPGPAEYEYDIEAFDYLHIPASAGRRRI